MSFESDLSPEMLKPTQSPDNRPDARGPKTLEQAIAESTRQMRKARRLTLAELAGRVGISRQMLSKIENAQTSASLATVDALAQGLEVPVTSLFRGADYETQAVFVKNGGGQETIRRGSHLGHLYHLLGKLTGHHSNLEPLLVTLTEDSETVPLFQHAGTEFVYVLEGEMEYQHQETTYHMQVGDSITFDGEGIHGATKILQAPVRFLSVFVSDEKVLHSFEPEEGSAMQEQ
ncbi:helix-turn-helix domain-containing protein [Auritidibacter ignavus]|uniref:helix-turn-helix domain-containing protein n=1 Tax=Auritidibacter ignavus TaxID=678932 RepID=UPI00244CD90F|nr:XRE family transcriptional regulator [Auritidibacter ignavus]WGH83585.1 XRE family transcriptional regulator [Auritidibacter ignavus]